MLVEMRIALDGTALVGARTGVGAVVHELTQGLAARPDVDLTVLLISRRAGADLARQLPPGAKLQRLPLPARLYQSVWRYSDRPKVTGFDVVHGPNYVVPPAGTGAELVSIHDFTPWRYPDLVSGASRRFPDLVDAAIRRGTHIVTGSEFVAAEAAHFLPVPDYRIHAIPNGVRPGLAGDASRGRAASGGNPYVLALGTIEPRKDHPTLLRAFAELVADHDDLRLVVVGGDGWGLDAYEAAVAETGLTDRIVRLGYVDETTKADLIAGASVFAYPSIYEGFGFPPLEAMAAGVPVVSTCAGSLPEVLGDGALLVPVGDVAALANAMSRALTDDTLRARLVEAGQGRVDRYQWPEAIDSLVELYKQLSSPVS